MNIVEAAAAVTAAAGPISDLQTDIPRIARDAALTTSIDAVVGKVDTSHRLLVGDSRDLSALPSGSIHLVVTSPPYWILKRYNDAEGQLGHLDEYDTFLAELDRVWSEAFRVLTPGGRLVCVVGDVCLSRRQNNGRHTVVPLHSSIAERCRHIGFDGLAPIIWYKIANVALEAVGNGGGFLGKPYEPNAVVKNDIEFVLMQRKPGGYRKPSTEARLLSVIAAANHREWFQQIWTGISGASTKAHPAPFPVELAERLIRMFSFVGDTVLDPFVGSGTTMLAAAKWGRNSVGVEIDHQYASNAAIRIRSSMPQRATLTESVMPTAAVDAA